MYNFIDKARSVHKDKFDYSEVEYKNTRTKVKIICPNKHVFYQRPCDHLQGAGCQECKRSTKDEFIQKANKVHNNFFSYDKVEYKQSTIKVIITCPIHGDWEQKPNDHLNGCGCPTCWNQTKDSKKLKEFDKFLIDNNIEYESEKRYDTCRGERLPLPFDRYIPSLNLLIEYDGEQHFKIVEHWGGIEAYERIQKYDLIKTQYCFNNNIDLLRIKYNENPIEKFQEFIKDKSR